MIPKKLLVATRGEIAIRILRAASELGVPTVAIFSEDDSLSLHIRKADQAIPLNGVGAAAYADIEQILSIAKAAGCDAIHPGCGFRSESAQFARRCGDAGITFVGPRAEIFDLFSDEQQARVLAERCGVPIVHDASTPPRSRRIEVQIVGDGASVCHLFERETSIQLVDQAIVAVAPCPSLDAAMRLAKEVSLDGLATFEFLIIENAGDDDGFAFVNAKPGLQPEHPVTEEILSIDLVKTELKLAGKTSLQEIGPGQNEIAKPRGFAIQLRINAESIDANGTIKPATGTLTAFEMPSGPGIRVDTSAYAKAHAHS
ncbi:MAG: biotin carboxylase N-terminal domain-containing protein [Candidatus Binatus sp.]|uniref:biotin carboxylase N-terminal domain-containing protein n=1 Tax=Candidatus Binatus sp. TaxID=2811406 RepID=UPI0027197352|nr:biotin carboxylase N-terminal domain-containing protein [Candidatus Binatus sp.]MDO8434196.1 biotin carboxylase N-terminal domain-containing protein [Candidatus Binatus sp.]